MTSTPTLRLPRARVIPIVLVALLAVTGCTTPTESDGSVRKVCGQLINSAAGNLKITWYHDLTRATHPGEIDLPATQQPDDGAAPWLLVSHDCSHGASVTIAPSGKARFIDSVKTAEGNYAAVQLDAHRPGIVTLTVHQGARLVSSTTIRTAEVAAPSCPAAVASGGGPSCP